MERNRYDHVVLPDLRADIIRVPDRGASWNREIQAFALSYDAYFRFGPIHELGPFANASLALTIGWLLGLGTGDLTLLAVLAASGSYIVVPAVVRYAIPEALPSRYFTLALGITFPINVAIGIPLYYAVASAIAY